MNNFYTGVVEDRHDPLSMGRVRVRVFGIHSDDRVNDVPIDSLPWSMVMQPANVSSTAGGISQLVEGTWVLIMYLDQNMQDPLVVGSLPSTIGSQAPDYSKGFTDPFGVYPKWSDGTADTSLAAKPDTYTEHPVYTERARTRVPSVPAAKRYKVSTVAEDAVENSYERNEWNELDLRNNQKSQYPYNSVHEYEGGMLEEFDSTPSNQRVTRMHPSGTYDEVIVDGTRTIKIVGDGYEIILGNKNMYVKGNVNMTVDGSMNQLVKGDYTLEVGGNFYQTVGGSKESKIVGNDVKEVGQDVSINIAAEYYVKCGNTHSLSVGSDKLEVIAGAFQREVGTDYASTVGGTESRYTKGDHARICLANLMEVTKGNHNIETRGAVTIDTDANLNFKVGSNMLTEVTSNVITEIGNEMITDVGSSVSETIGGGLSIQATGSVDIDGSTIDLN